jgi:hypothetical protein
MRKYIRGLLVGLVFAVALFTTARMLNEVELFAEIATLRDKWEHYGKQKDRYDTLWFGSSRIYRGIMPGLFDQLTAEGGVPTKTFNFGLDGMFPPEDAYVIERALEDPPKNLRWVFIEIGLYIDDFENRNPAQVRTVYWHDLERTWLCTRSRLWPKGKPEKWKSWFRSVKGKAAPASDVALHWRLFFEKTLNLGRGSDLLADRFLQRRERRSALGPDNDGFYPMPPERVMTGPVLAAYEAEMQKFRKTPAKIRPLPLYGEECLAKLVKRVREIGAEPVVFIAPTDGGRREYPSEKLALGMIDLRIPQDFPELFDPGMRADATHMNAAGAEAMTRRIAEKFVPIARSKGSSQTPTSSPSR